MTAVVAVGRPGVGPLGRRSDRARSVVTNIEEWQRPLWRSEGGCGALIPSVLESRGCWRGRAVLGDESDVVEVAQTSENSRGRWLEREAWVEGVLAGRVYRD